jgi:hypothetical protein
VERWSTGGHFGAAEAGCVEESLLVSQAEHRQGDRRIALSPGAETRRNLIRSAISYHVLPHSSRSLLDAVYATLGGRSDQTVDGAAAWFKWALVIVFLVNLIEALALLQFSKPHFNAAATKPIGLSQPPRVGGPVTAIATPPPPSATSARSRGPSEARYSPHSPLKASLEAAGRSVSGNFNSSSPAQSSPLNPSGLPNANARVGSVAGRRLPSAPPTSGSSPLAAYLARRGTPREQERRASSDFDGVGDLSSESIEVDRALRALSNSYMRSSSAAAAAPAPQTPVSHAR